MKEIITGVSREPDISNVLVMATQHHQGCFLAESSFTKKTSGQQQVGWHRTGQLAWTLQNGSIVKDKNGEEGCPRLGEPGATRLNSYSVSQSQKKLWRTFLGQLGE